MKVFLIDITRHKGPVERVTFAARAYAKQNGANQITWLNSRWQSLTLASGEKVLTVDGSVAEALIEQIRKLSAESFRGAQFVVCSYDSLSRRKPLDLLAEGIEVAAVSLATIIAGAKFNQPSMPRSIPDRGSPEVLPLADGIVLAQQLLRDGVHISASAALPQVQLRLRLTKLDPRAVRDPNRPESISLISRIVNEGLRSGWLGRSLRNGLPGTEMIWLRDETERPSIVSPEVSAANEPDPAKGPDLGKSRTDEFTSYLRTLGVHVQKDVRDLLFDAARQHVGDGKTATQLFRVATETAISKAPENHVKSLNWPAAASSALKLALRAGIVEDGEGKVLVDTFRDRGAKVGKLAADATDKVDVYLLVLLIDKLGNLNTRDAVSIAHALYKGAPNAISRDEMVDRVLEVVNLAGAEIVEDEDGVLHRTVVPPVELPKSHVATVVN